eukprot:CAMPEP_0172540874 /NCGR_PEP_ID=MMETSP1067-20121228/11787_1 /TAXON_ID=265564 ORGANISM="Thalassiosira punctigera, Strain Tpunct2005C2" /NCGR_SAMPLE_ID=MMETSP1067 /ASSEMBLY_ACC=CAM_ASM_000444 /LENGTH=314 /DNA_ID=CAMNT_0013326799 /DNA_START=28 /DNA_END=972 /DNA_ORIENTATION=-
MASASVFLRRLALPAATRTTQQQLRSATLGIRTNLPSLSSTHSGPNHGATSRGGSGRGAATISAGDALARLASDHPHQEVIRYEHKNVKWTLKHVNYYSDALACGLVDAGLQPGDVVLSWLPMHFAEQHILQFACSKAGFLLYHLDPNPELAKSNPEAAKVALAKALELTEANVLITQEAGDDVNYIDLTTGVVPEIRIFDFGEGMPFFTPRYPHLRFPVHTGYTITDNEGMYLFKHFLVPTNNLDSLLRGTGCKALDGKTPLLGELVLDKEGVPMKTGEVMTNEEVFKAGTWPEFSSILKREYKEIPGVGVVF